MQLSFPILNIVALKLKSCLNGQIISHIFTNNWLSSQFAHRTYDFIIQQGLASNGVRLFYLLTCWILMRKVVFLPVALIKEANNEGWLRSLAYFVRLKSLYKNNTHYNFSLRSLAKKAQCCPVTLSVHLKELEKHGLIRRHGGNMTFSGLQKLRDKYKPATIGVKVDFKNQYDIVRGQIVRFNLSAQEYNIKKSGSQIQHCAYVLNTKKEKASSSYVGLSALGVGNLFGLTGASGSRIRKKLKLLGQIEAKKVFCILLRNISEKQYQDMKWIGSIPIYSKYKEGNVVVERRNRISYIGAVSELQKINTA